MDNDNISQTSDNARAYMVHRDRRGRGWYIVDANDWTMYLCRDGRWYFGIFGDGFFWPSQSDAERFVEELYSEGKSDAN